MPDTHADIENDLAAIGRIQAVPTMLQVLCDITGMRFAAVARVTNDSWTACAVQDGIGFSLAPGGQLDLNTTLCKDVRETNVPIVIEHASDDTTYRTHQTPRTYGIESYISVPIVLPDHSYFGSLCAIDPLPAKLTDPCILSMFNRFAALIGMQLQSERRSMALQSALLGERATGELREQLVAVLGHNLRVPLGAIAMGCELLQARSADPRVGQAVAGIRQGTKRISALVDAALELLRGSLGAPLAIQLKIIERIDQDLYGVVSELQAMHPERSIEWSFDLPRPVSADRGRIQQLAFNLMKNALVHGSPNGLVRLTAGDDGSNVSLTVWNEGPPIAAADIPDLFRPLWRNGHATHEAHLGLGLHICSQIVKAHRGELTVASTAADGTAFSVRLPQPAVAGLPDAARASP
jgi:signal transduction histidine kinase